MLVVVRGQFVSLRSEAKLTLRNFYGVLSVKEHDVDDPERHTRDLMNGRILHGTQIQDPVQRRLPTTYYNDTSGVGLTLLNFREDRPLRVGVVGLGTGTIAAYGGPGDYYCFYEINPNVVTLARSQFTFLADSIAQVNVLLGDARLTLERQKPQAYDIIALDAFSGDAIPVHLLTQRGVRTVLPPSATQRRHRGAHQQSALGSQAGRRRDRRVAGRAGRAGRK